jgi:uncharacterized protein YbaP (TraB family)
VREHPLEKAMMRRLLNDRNGPMADKIARLHRGQGGLFVAVGSLHMVGPRACRHCWPRAASPSPG